ncbi:MAG: type II secretion system protein [Solirubrobacterales bacterium]
MKSHKGFTMLEITVAILIVGLLVATAVPLLSGRIDASKWSEARTTMDTIASALRSYAAQKGSFANAPTLAELGLSNDRLDGAYFSHQAYAITSACAVDGRVAFEITCTAAKSVRGGKPCSPARMTLTSNATNNYGTTFAESNGS